jgi:DNA-directed RNA polymerase specialized sigma24 family protein
MLRRVSGRESDAVHDPDTATAETVRRALRQLPIDLRAVVVLRFYADLSVTDTAAVLRIPEGTVKTKTRRALTGLRDAGLSTTEVTDAL